MIVVFVIDTSPSMAKPAVMMGDGGGAPNSGAGAAAGGGTGMSRLDVAKMIVEDLVRGLRKRWVEHARTLQQEASQGNGRAWVNLGLATPLLLPQQQQAGQQQQQQQQQQPMGFVGNNNDALLLLSTSRQHPDTASCAAGGRLLVGFGSMMGGGGSMMSGAGGYEQQQQQNSDSASAGSEPWRQQQQHEHLETFQRELKGLRAASPPSTGGSDDSGGATGMNIALSCGLQLLSRYRLHNRLTENFGMGRLPSTSLLNASNGAPSTAALQPACLVLLTDGACLRSAQGGGGGGGGRTLQLQYGSQPLREFYKEPFRWDQRIFCLGVGAAGENVTSQQYLHPQLRALCEVTGGAHCLVRDTSHLQQLTDSLLKRISPPLPRELPLRDPLFRHPRLNVAPLPQLPNAANSATSASQTSSQVSSNAPVICLGNAGGPTAGIAPNTASATFANGGPICCLQALESDDPTGHTPPVKLRAMLLYTASPATNIVVNAPSNPQQAPTTEQRVPSQPLWPIPEAYFPSKKLDTLPPRQAQPVLWFSKHPSNLGTKSFDPLHVINMLHRLDQLVLFNRDSGNGGNAATVANQAKCLHRDVYCCEWISPTEGNGNSRSSSSSVQAALRSLTRSSSQQQQQHGAGDSDGGGYFPVMVPGAGRPTLTAEDGDNYLNIGILHVPSASTLASTGGHYGHALTTLTFLPPEPHILLPLLLRAAEAEYRVLLKRQQQQQQQLADNPTQQAAGGSSNKYVVHLDDQWRSEFRAYLFRLPPYYQYTMKRALRPVLPASVHTLLMTDAGGGGMDSLAMQCCSKLCLQKIRNGEQASRDNNERLERQEASLKRRDVFLTMEQQQQERQQGTAPPTPLRYGQFDPRSSVDSYLTALRNMPPPWRAAGHHTSSAAPATSAQTNRGNLKSDRSTQQDMRSETASTISDHQNNEDSDSSPRSVVDLLGDLPAECLMAYYESRRRWIFGGTGLTCKGLHVEGVANQGTNSQRCRSKPGDPEDECVLSIGGVGVSRLNQTTTHKMGDYRERLLFSRSPVVGYGANDAAGVAATTAPDGSPKWSVDDDALPVTFFDPKTGEFADSVTARVRSRMLVNFGNPYKEHRGDALIPQMWLSQAPSMQKEGSEGGTSPRTPPGSPPHDSFESVEEGEAVFVRKSPSRSSPTREEPDDLDGAPPTKRARYESPSSDSETKTPPPPPPTLVSDTKSAPKTPMASARPPPPPSAGGQVKRPNPPPKPTTPTTAGKGLRKPPPPPPPQSRPSTTSSQHSPSPRPSISGPSPPPPRRSIVAPPPVGPPPLHHRRGSLPAPPLSSRPSVTSPASRPSITAAAPPRPKGMNPSSSGQKPPPYQQQQQHTSQQQGNNTGSSSEQQQQVDDQALQNPEVKPSVDLPPGWMCVWSKSQKRWYFFNTKTNKSVWKWPP